jgi:RNA polymerase sigma-70 factor (ECF subfamily)
MNRRERTADELLVLRCQEGDADGFEELLGRWQERLWRHAWRLTGDEAAAWDVLQETWIAVARDVARLEDAAMFPGWAYRITSNKCRDWIRREVRRRRADEVYPQQVVEAQGETGDSPQVASLKEALARLSGEDRAILALRYEEAFDTAEIAEIIGVPPGTVKSRLYYARQRLRQFLEESGDE